MTKTHVVWLTGLSGSGKSTIAESTKKMLGGKYSIKIIDGDEVRKTINKNLGFSTKDIIKNNNKIIGYKSVTRPAQSISVFWSDFETFIFSRNSQKSQLKKC